MGKVLAAIATAALLAPIIALAMMGPSTSVNEQAWSYCVVFGVLAYGAARLWDSPTSAPASVLTCWILVVIFEIVRLKYYGQEFLDFKLAGVIGGLLGAPIGAIWSKWPERKPWSRI